MRSRNFLRAPAAVVISGLLLAGTAGAAFAAPPDDSPSASSSAAGSDSGGASGDDAASGGANTEELSSSWKPDGWYDSEHECKKAGDKGKQQHKWHDYRCKKEKRHHDDYDYYWHLYYRR
ncbi:MULTISPECIES: hypothetical protein [Streptomyces]|uniref:hypothetical protein n=1 Tax=Streptomyces TaxID=1883 RepID=UPI00163CFE3C|nr:MULTISPECIES: hypothetical protein [Streptomyces]MBC2879656.1 hypothetical protein [Streptomyces sp. TYQ1024]UBI35094.1 hypothetical protein K7I03_00585 [Streptomyces mobaraensis]UKW27687.1 hypothetical protein MCU78_00625 [Streptomyces sp. TYQ1024]